MAGVLFLVNIPRKEHEKDLKEKFKSANLAMEKEKYERASKLIRELKKNKRFGNMKSSFESYVHEDVIKFKSTECINEDGDGSLFKSKSENVLNESYKLAMEGDYQVRKKSWGDIKQVMKRKKKLQITQPPSMTDILTAFHWDTPLEIILAEVITRLEISNVTWTSTKENNNWQVLFSLDSSYVCEELLQVLRNFGIGSRYQSSVSVVPCALYYKGSQDEDDRGHFENENEGLQSDADSAWSRFSSSVRARTNLAQVLHYVREDAALTFDWLFLLIVAAFVAAIGLVENSTVILVASMLISPLMGPITAGTLGTAVRDHSLQVMGVLHEMLGLFLAMVMGFIFGLTICSIDERYGLGDWPTYEMVTRCEIRSLWLGVLVAIPSGAGVALSVLGGNTASLVGVAISASLLPPAVNAGLLWAMSLVHLVSADETRQTRALTTYYSSHQPTELAVLGAISLALTLVNIACVFLAGVAVYKVKEVCPLDRRDILWWKTNSKSDRSCKQLINNNITWEKYSNWSNESKPDQETKAPIPLVHSDTVTYRHETPAIKRMRAQNIEAYCLQKQQFTSMSNHYEADIEDGRHIYNSIDNFSALETNMNNLRISNEEDKDFYSKDCITDLDDVNSFSNRGFEEQENLANKSFEQNVEESQCPIIEPSSNYTVDPKNPIILGSKSYNV